MSEVSVNISPKIDKLIQGYIKAGKNVKSAMNKAIAEYAFAVERYAVQVTPYKTGYLRSTIRTRLGNLEARVGTFNVNYAVYVHEGTRYMKARPFMLWGIEFATRKFNDRYFADKLDQALVNSLRKL